MMKAIFRGRVFEFDENDQEAITKLADTIGCSVEYIIAAIQKVIDVYGPFSCSIEMTKDKFHELSEACDDMIEKAMQYEHVRIKEKPKYCTFKSRLKPYEKRRSFQRPVFWKRTRSNPQRKPP